MHPDCRTRQYPAALAGRGPPDALESAPDRKDDLPETSGRAFADVFGGITQLGVKRQKQELLEALRRCYLRAGVLIDDPEVRSDPQWERSSLEKQP